MAKIQFSALLSDARKKIGSAVFSKSRTGNYVRIKKSPTQPRTSAQRSVRSAFSTNSKAWPGTLTAAERAGWNSLAASSTRKDRFGNSFKPTGLQLYQLCARNAQTCGAATLASAPANLDVDSPISATLTAHSAAGGTLTVAVGTNPAAGDYVIVAAAAPISAGRTFVGKLYRVLEVFTGPVSPPMNILSAYTTKFGSLATGQNINVLVYYINSTTFAASGKVSAQAICT